MMKKLLLPLLLALLACNGPALLLEPTPQAPAVVSIPTTTPQPTLIPTVTITPSLVVHVVQSGETLTEIAERYGLTPEYLADFNNINPSDPLTVGKRLFIPPPDNPLDLFPTLTPLPTQSNIAPDLPDNPSAGIYGESQSNVLYEYSIPYLSRRAYDGGTIRLGGEPTNGTVGGVFRQYQFWHQSEGVEVTGLVNIPEGEGPFPVAIIMHGGILQSAYYQGWGTANHASRLAEAGYIAFMPDYQTYNDTDGTGYPLKIPWALDVMNLIEALPTVPQADPERIGVMGHSRGGGLAAYIMVLNPEVDAVVLYAPLHLDQSIVWERYNNVFGAEWPREEARTIGTPDQNPAGYRMTSPWYYLEQTRMPVQIHHGAADGTLPVDWARDLYDRMLLFDLEAEYYEYEGGQHTFTGQDYTTFITRTITFFDAHVK